MRVASRVSLLPASIPRSPCAARSPPAVGRRHTTGRWAGSAARCPCRRRSERRARPSSSGTRRERPGLWEGRLIDMGGELGLDRLLPRKGYALADEGGHPGPHRLARHRDARPIGCAVTQIGFPTLCRIVRVEVGQQLRQSRHNRLGWSAIGETGVLLGDAAVISAVCAGTRPDCEAGCEISQSMPGRLDRDYRRWNSQAWVATKVDRSMSGPGD